MGLIDGALASVDGGLHAGGGLDDAVVDVRQQQRVDDDWAALHQGSSDRMRRPSAELNFAKGTDQHDNRPQRAVDKPAELDSRDRSPGRLESGHQQCSRRHGASAPANRGGDGGSGGVVDPERKGAPARILQHEHGAGVARINRDGHKRNDDHVGSVAGSASAARIDGQAAFAAWR